ncbi:MAG: hypothetical protein HZB29_08265 [Nitrospinae bacterium]|nr:hypothetical protein [Nitrospinota bacterium]
MKDIEDQITFVAGSVERLLSQMDHDPLSPTYGCMSLSYWRDKTSDVADARRQEAALTFALLFKRDYPGSGWRGSSRLRNAVIAAISFWRQSQYSDGSLDEWYKGERAFAAAAFTTFAMARTLEVMGDDLPEEVLLMAREGLELSAGWLTRRNDLFKTNHQAVGVAALAFAAKALGNERLTVAAKEKLDSIIAVQTPEGWFPEVGHMDPGYTFLTVEYVAMAMDLWDDWSQVGPFVKAYDFACEWVHPDLRLGEEYGVCHNPYVSRIAAILMEPHSGRAEFLRGEFAGKAAGFESYKNTLGDELRLSRWAYQPLLAHYYALKTLRAPRKQSEEPPLFGHSSDRRMYKSANIGWFSGKNYTAVFAPAAGGLVRIFNSENLKQTADFGYAIKLDDGMATNLTYNRSLPYIEEGGAMSTKAPVSAVKKFMPSFAARVGLRLACSTATGSRLARMAIDKVRERKGTALNQSSANLAANGADITLRRVVTPSETSVEVEDELLFGEAAGLDNIMFYHSSGFEPELSQVAAPGAPAGAKIVRLCVTRRYDVVFADIKSSVVKITIE